MLDQDGVISFLDLNVQAPVNICAINDSLHRACDGAGRPCCSRHIVAMDRAAINASKIHIERLIILISFALAVTNLLCGWEDHPHQQLLQLQRGWPQNNRLNVCYQDCLLSAGANREGPYFRRSTGRRSFLASS